MGRETSFGLPPEYLAVPRGQEGYPAVTPAGEELPPSAFRLVHRMETGAARGRRWLVLEVSHHARDTVWLSLRFHRTAGADPVADIHAGRFTLGINPLIRLRAVVDLGMMQEVRAFPRRLPGMGFLANSGPAVPLDDIEAVSVLAVALPPAFRMTVHRCALAVRPGRPRAISRRPLVDEFGQYAPRRWPGKARGVGPEEPPPAPVAVPRLASRMGRKPAKFRVEREGNRWWLVDPAGMRMFSSGINHVMPRADTFLTGARRLFGTLPPRRGLKANAWRVFSNRRTGARSVSLSHYTANLVRRYGSAWHARWADLALRRLDSWGFNTVGNWSDHAVCGAGRMPYVLMAEWWDEPRTPAGWGVYAGFPDVFSPAFESRCDRAARAAARPEDSRLLGYFIHNEPLWGRGRVNVAQLALATGRAPATRDFLLRWLAGRYGRRGVRPSDADLARMQEMMFDRYFRVVCGALRRHDPGRLLLGIRFADEPPSALLGPMKYMDVVSLNCYAPRPPLARLDPVHRATGKPVIIGEFFLGATDRGMTCPGLVAAANQRERGASFRYYMEQAASIPYVVGAHWFEYNDHAVLGRHDGENYNCGFVDVMDRPYPELVAAARASNPLLPLVHAGRRGPVRRAPRLSSNVPVW